MNVNDRETTERLEALRQAVEASRVHHAASERVVASAQRTVHQALERLEATSPTLGRHRHREAVGLEPLLEHLDKVLATEELERRPAPDAAHAAEEEAHRRVAEAFEIGCETGLRRLVEVAQRLCEAETAGVSIAEDDPKDGRVFRWRATAGALRPLQGTALPYAASPCGLVVERGETLLMEWPEWVYPAVAAVRPRVAEVLLVPVVAGEEIQGTLWAMNHGGGRPFNAEDRRVLEGLSRFVTLAL